MTYDGPPAPPVQVRCVEDSACYVWSKQGNRKRGVTINGALRIVGPCEFRTLWQHRKVRVTMRGDWYAINNGC